MGTLDRTITVTATANNISITSSVATIKPEAIMLTPDKDVIISSPYTNDGEWRVIRGFNLATEFQKANNRLPRSGENIVLTIPDKWALIGNSASMAGITVDDRLNGVNSITIINNGLIGGLGGNGAGGDWSGGRGLKATDGGNGITNTSTKTIMVTNNNLIGGGGGGNGPSGVYGNADTVHGGCGAVPYGYSHRAGRLQTEPLLDGLITGNYGNVTVRFGVNGKVGNRNFSTVFGYAGFIKSGLVQITNVGAGRTVGRS